ncbi:MAG: T9SS type A sorting domain-containing protein [Candidatus Poribacteria bacterium]|nr:T9SS type A sorting domain-containing protein [Candidatus Poribacteria bacterium]
MFYTFTLFMCFNSFFLKNSAAQVGDGPGIGSASDNYTFETIDVPDVDFLAVTASSDFEDYAGYTKSADGEKMVGFTLIDGVFKTYDFPGSQNTYFYALDNKRVAAGHYEDSDGLHHGVVLEDGELRQYDFPDAVETEIYGISDATGALTGNFTDASGVRRGFSGEIIVEYPEATATYADFVNAGGVIVGSYIDADGLYHVYMRTPDGRFVSLDRPPPQAAKIEYLFVHGISDAGVIVARAKLVGSVPRTSVGTFQHGLQGLKVPGSISTEGWNINQDGSIVGYYDTADGRRHGFIARLAPDAGQPVVTPTSFNYTFENIDVPGVAFLAVTASSDFDDYAGYTKSADGQKMVAFTLIDGVFTTYDFPGSQNTYFYALGNNGQAAGHYEDSEGLHHGVVLEDGELRQYDFPGAVQTEIYGISDATGALTGNFTDASGVRRGFSGDVIVEFPGAPETYADFVNASGRMVGSYVDADGLYHSYVRAPDGSFISLDLPLPQAAKIEYLFVHGISDAGVIVAQGRLVGGVPRTYVGTFQHGLQELKVPGSVSTEGWNINQDGSVVGHYDSADGRRHGFIARPVDEAKSSHYGNFYTVKLSKGLNMLSVPLESPKPMTAKSLAGIIGATMVIALDAENQRFIGWTPDAPNDGFPIEGGQGYIVNVPETRNFAFVGSRWENQTEVAAAPAISAETPKEAWAFVVSGHLEGKTAFDGYQVIVRNLRTDTTVTASVQGDYFAATTADLARRSVVQVGDVVELRVIGTDGNFESQTRSFKVTPEHLANAVLSVKLDSIGKPMQNHLLQNYPNPFNPETWIPYQLSEDSSVSVSIYDTTGKVIRSLSLGFQSAGFYNSRGRAAYWDGRNALGERVASGIYFYQLATPSFQQTRRLVIVK